MGREFDIDADTGTPVAEDYQVPFRFTGKLDKLTLTIDRPKLTPVDIEKLKQAYPQHPASEQPRRRCVARTSAAPSGRRQPRAYNSEIVCQL